MIIIATGFMGTPLHQPAGKLRTTYASKKQLTSTTLFKYKDRSASSVSLVKELKIAHMHPSSGAAHSHKLLDIHTVMMCDMHVATYILKQQQPIIYRKEDTHNFISLPGSSSK